MTPHSATIAWQLVLDKLIHRGQPCAPRGQPILELIGYSFTIDMKHPVVGNPKRKLGYKFMAAEAYWILMGDDRVETIAPYSKAIANFSGNGVTFDGAYGPKVVAQLEYVVQTLVNDRDTRQAVMTIWRENPGPSKDIPCTVAVQFLIRDGLLHCVDTMRSSDVWLGVPYDLFNFSMISMYVALRLREVGVHVELGTLTLQAGSQHLYERNLKDAEDAYICFDTLPGMASTAMTVSMFTSPEHLCNWLRTYREHGIDRWYEEQIYV